MLYRDYYHSSLGILEIIANERYIIALSFVKRIRKTISNTLTTRCVVQLRQYFFGQRKIFDLPVYCAGTIWQSMVWQKLLQIPFARVISYQDLATYVGRPKSARALGQAVHQNKIAILIPCHRVVGADGKLVGYAAGLGIKKKLLDLEKNFD